VPPLAARARQHGRAVHSRAAGAAGGAAGGAEGGAAGGAAALSHIDAEGKAAMVDVSAKVATGRSATAEAVVALGEVAYGALTAAGGGAGGGSAGGGGGGAGAGNAKGDVLGVARVAGVLGAKRTAELIPLCHPLALSHVSVDFELRPPPACEVVIRARARCVGATGVEMEALTAAGVAALTVYDMCKAASKGIVIREVRLLEKTGGKSGTWRAPDSPPPPPTDPSA